MKKQKLFDVVLKHAVTMDKKAINKYGYAQYHSKKNGFCLIGALIKDKHYKKSMEGTMIIADDSIVKAIKKSGFDIDSDNVELLYALQKAHDHIKSNDGLAFVSTLFDNLFAVARNNGIKFKKKYKSVFDYKIATMAN
jgi:hypothetical protein